MDGDILDQEVELVDKDIVSETDTALERAKKLIEDDNVAAMIGTSDSAAGIRVADYVG